MTDENDLINTRVQRFSANPAGRDFVVGDVHGELEVLWRKLDAAGFDVGHDRLFSVGDLVDRGPDSPGVLALLDEPWFFAVQGNHENLLIDAVLYGIDTEQWQALGGEWSRSVDRRWLRQQARRLENLPHVIVVGEGAGRFNIVHAGLVDYEGQVLQDADIDDPAHAALLDCDPLLWSRVLARDYWRFLQGRREPGPAWQTGLSLTLCGHTPVSEAGLYRSHYFLDGGSGYVQLAGLRPGEPFLVDAGRLVRELAVPQR